MPEMVKPDLLHHIQQVVRFKGRVEITFAAYLDAFDWRGEYDVAPEQVFVRMYPRVAFDPGQMLAEDPRGRTIEARPWLALMAFAKEHGMVIEEIDLDTQTIGIRALMASEESMVA